ncbi:MAG: hypothetical protein HZB38_09735 [Planctomycetes bacterium]|nr:hypothetical protein [Planctomycetota bacterium]
MGTAILCGLLLAMQSSQPASPPASQRDTAAASEILKKMRRVYAECKSYQDEGTTQTVISGDGREFTNNMTFKTRFVRPDRFRFEFRARSHPDSGPWNLYVVWARGDKIQSWWTVRPEVEKHRSLERALAGPTGISSGSAVNIPGLLMTDMNWGSGLRQVRAAGPVRDGTINGSSCWQIDVEQPAAAGNKTTLWIDPKSLLILRIVENATLQEQKLKATTTHDIKAKIDIDVPDSDFDFDPAVEEKAASQPARQEPANRKP